MQSPDDPRARYNYAVAAYASGQYATAIASFEKLARAGDFTVEPRARAQLGNSLFRSGEEMQPTNPDGAVAQWEKALAAYRSAPEMPAAVHNAAKVQTDLLALLRGLAAAKIAEGDEIARLNPEKGVPAWREAMGRLDQALKLSDSEAEQTAIVADRTSVTGRIYGAYLTLGSDKHAPGGAAKRQCPGECHRVDGSGGVGF